MEAVFVYGTLKTGEPNHDWMTDWHQGSYKKLGKGRTVEAYPLVIATIYNIPFLLDRPGVGNQIDGEVYEVDDRMMKRLDELEEHPDFYVRMQRPVVLEDGTPITCWIYVIQTFRENLLELPFHSNYSSTGPHGLIYCEKYLRPDAGYTAKDDVRGTLPEAN